MKILNDKNAMITGGASGIGRALYENLAQYGAIVTVADIDHGGAELNMSCSYVGFPTDLSGFR